MPPHRHIYLPVICFSLTSSIPVSFSPSQRPSFMDATACGMFIASARMCDIVSSAVDTMLPPGVFITKTSVEVAAGTLILSTPIFYFSFVAWIWRRHRAMRDDVNDLGSNIRITLAAEM